MARYTLTQVRNTFEFVTAAASDAGVDTSLWILKEGSSTYGNTWGIVNRTPDTGAQSSVATFGFTREDAYQGMVAMVTAFRLVTFSGP